MAQEPLSGVPQDEAADAASGVCADADQIDLMFSGGLINGRRGLPLDEQELREMLPKLSFISEALQLLAPLVADLVSKGVIKGGGVERINDGAWPLDAVEQRELRVKAKRERLGGLKLSVIGAGQIHGHEDVLDRP